MEESTDNRPARVIEEARAEYTERDRRSARFSAARRAADRGIRDRTARSYARIMRSVGIIPLGRRAVLDVGCGDGEFLLRCRDEWGQTDAPLCGIDLMENRIDDLMSRVPFLDARAGSADALPWDDNTFDLCHQSMLLSSVLDEDLRLRMAKEMQRVTAPGGFVLWYDFTWNPVNKATVGMPLKRVRSYFPGWEVAQRKRVTLAPPLSRPLARVSNRLIEIIEACRIFNTFELLLLRKPDQTSDLS